MPNINHDLLATANWFSELSRNAYLVARKYRAADRKAQKAKKAVRTAIQYSKVANLYGEKILGGQVTSNGSNMPQNVPMVVTDRSAHEEIWNRWFAEQQAEMEAEMEAAAKASESEDEDEE